MVKKHGIPATEHLADDLPERVVSAGRAVAYVQLADASEQPRLQLMHKTKMSYIMLPQVWFLSLVHGPRAGITYIYIYVCI